MGVVYKKIVEDDCILGFWDITESFEQLYQMVPLHEEEQQLLSSFGNDKRKAEWLSVRALVNNIQGLPTRIVYNEDRKPFLQDGSNNISISHSQELTSILLSNNKLVGIDIEFMSHKIAKLADKFINEAEFITSNSELTQYHLYIHWCSKEAIYKICDKSNINFKDHIVIEHFQPNEQGIVKGYLKNEFRDECFDLHYSKHDNYVVVWTCK